MPVLKYTIEFDTKESLSKLRQEVSSIKKKAQSASSGGSKEASANEKVANSLKELRKELRRKISLVDADLRLGNKSQAEAEQSIKKIKQWAEAQGAFNRETLIGAQNLKTFANAQGRAKNDFRGMAAVTGRANQVLFDLNQGLQDVPFGMRGIGNNIPFVVEGFRRFGKAAREQGISPLKGFISAMMSPAGLIGTAAAVIPTIITLAAHWDEFLRMWGFGKTAANEYKEAVGGVIEQLGSLQSEINKFRGLDSLFDVEENLEQVRFLALLEEDVKDRQRKLLDEAGFKGGIAEALGGRGQALLSPEQQAEFDRLEELHNQTLNKRLELELKIKVAKDAQTLPIVKQKELHKEIAEQLEKADKLEKEALKRKKKLLEFEIEEIQVIDQGLDIGKETALLDKIKTDALNEQVNLAKQLRNLQRDFVRDLERLNQQITQNQLAGQLTLSELRIQSEQQFANELAVIQNSRFDSKLDRQRAEFESEKNFLQRKLQLEKKASAESKQIEQQLAQDKIQVNQLMLNALTSLSQGFAKDNKAVAIAILAIEKGLAVAQAVKEGAEKAGRAQILANFYAAQALTPVGPNPAAIAAAINAQAQVGAIKATTSATVAAILATGIGEAASILGQGSRTFGSSAGGGGRSGGDSFTRRTSNRFDKVSFLTPPKQQPVIINVTSKTNALELAWEVRNGEAEIKSDKL